MRIGCEVTFNPPGDGDTDCFYASAEKILGIEARGLKKVILYFLKSHKFDVSNYSSSNDKDKFFCDKWQRFLPELSASRRNSQQLQMLLTMMRHSHDIATNSILLAFKQKCHT